MLILSRRVGEEVLVPEHGVSVKVVAVKGRTVRLAITAPPEVDVWRAELWERDGDREPVLCGEPEGPA